MYEKLGQWLSHRNPPNEPIPAADYFASLPRLTTDRLLLLVKRQWQKSAHCVRHCGILSYPTHFAAPANRT